MERRACTTQKERFKELLKREIKPKTKKEENIVTLSKNWKGSRREQTRSIGHERKS